MEATIHNLLRSRGLSINQLSKESNIPVSTISYAFKQSVKKWNSSLLYATAKALHLPMDDLYEELSNERSGVEYNDDDHTINGIKVPREHYYGVRDAILFNVMEGWQPTDDEIRSVIANSINPNPIVEKEIQDAWGH